MKVQWKSSLPLISHLLGLPPGIERMNYPLIPADAAAHVWQLACCGVTLLFAMLSWMIGPR
ncbi:hypothetical protein-transmembrane prediction [Rhodopirellula baltica SH 1]|uniref:Uncharacterized protein n=1 Tax=Rhodopirellula baltica (strain DSM 10527 / NCIMB 13988 / SH1) TaxID=243090 RepID=Q7UGK4_RHOBA|nr:hypothetical protein-transmembrane prediction [Rhodopirellula baltica SH 1]